MRCWKILICGAVFIGNCGWAMVSQAAEENVEQTEVYGAAATADGQATEFLVKQGENAPNPLGNPLPTMEDTDNTASEPVMPENHLVSGVVSQVAPKVIWQENMQNPTIDEEPNPATMKDKIQDTLYESGGRIYDIQSYPVGDVKQIESPSQPTVTDYPAY